MAIWRRDRLIPLVSLSVVLSSCVLQHHNGRAERPSVEHGRYLATIGACGACHTPPAVTETPPLSTGDKTRERQLRAEPNWAAYLDPQRRLAGGVPFIIPFDATSHGVVVTPNITPDEATGLGSWTEDDIVRVLRTGVRKDGTNLLLFPPHTFYRHLSDRDCYSLARYLKSLPAVTKRITPRSLPPFINPTPQTPNPPAHTPRGRTQARAEYLMSALIGCVECHSHHAPDKGLVRFAGGDPVDPHNGTFRLGPDLPLRQNEKGFAAFPYPGYAVLYAGNLTRFGRGGDLHHVSTRTLVRAIRRGIAVCPDADGRPRPLNHVMLWQFYRDMRTDDALAIADYLKSLDYIPHSVEPRLIYFGSDWESAFEQVFARPPSTSDRLAFGKP